MSDKTIEIGDKMIEAELNEKSSRLNISVDDLIDRYLRRELYTDDYYVPRTSYTMEELLEMSKKAVEEDKKRGIFPKENNFDVFVGIMNKYDD